MKNAKYPVPRRLPVGFKRIVKNGQPGIEIDQSKAEGLRLALMLADSGRVSVRGISAIAAKYGITASEKHKKLKNGRVSKYVYYH